MGTKLMYLLSRPNRFQLIFVFLVSTALVCVYSSVTVAESILLSLFPRSIDNKCVIEKKTLHRYPDPVVILGKDLHALMGRENDRLRVLALMDGHLTTIPYQVDERTVKGDFVFTHGPKANLEERTGRLTPQDELIIMAKDLGDRIGGEGWIYLGQSAIELEVTDPLDNTKAWAYLVFFATDPPPRSPENYCRWIHEEDMVQCRSFEFTYGSKGKHIAAYTNITIHPEGEGNETNFVDRFKVRVTLKLLFSLITINISEEKLLSKTLCWIDGPVRVVRRESNYINLGYGLRTPSIDHDVIYYFNSIVTFLRVHLPFRPSLFFSKGIIQIGTDYSPEAFGMIFWNSNNPEGFLVDGSMSPQEAEMNRSKDLWRVVSGVPGTFLTRQVAPTKKSMLFFEQAYVGLEYMDDLSTQAPPESSPGEVGHAFQVFDLMKLKQSGTYDLVLEWYFPEGYRPGDEQYYLHKSDYPLTYVANQLGN